MARMLGDRVLPEAVQSQRRKLRSRLQSVREPVRSFREQNIPGPDVVGTVENQVTDLRSKVVSRDSVIGRVKEMRSDDSNSEEKTDSVSNTKQTIN